MLTVCCVLKSGGDYTPAQVTALRKDVERYLIQPHRFVCLTDMPVDCESIPLKHGWPGWFSKIEAFRPGLFDGPVFYTDLDVRIIGPLDDIVLGHRFTVLRNFWADTYGEPNRIGSGLMAWSVDLSSIYEAFARTPEKFVRLYQTKAHWGDQAFIKEYVPIAMARWQDKHPGKVVSFKRHVKPKGRVPKGASICCFHGQPRPWGLDEEEAGWFERVGETA